ncbi:FecR domain-containing protein [Rubritalea spongiae]|uniref:FecR domain-containing protein n=1 Tax=Rubritalea spongiae TaxID=430797 RepID=A0ABW5E3D5_9BACT
MNLEIVVLIEKIWDNSISATELEQLRNRLTQEPELRCILAAELHTKGLLFAAGCPDSDCSEVADKVGMVVGANTFLQEHEDKIIERITQAQTLQTTRPKPASRKTALIAFTLATAASIAFLVGLYLSRPIAEAPLPIATITQTAEGASILRADQQLNVAQDQALFTGDHITTGEQQELHISFIDDPSTLILKQNTELKVTANNGSKRIILQRGSLLCDIAKQPSEAPLIVQTPQAEITVLGTRFILSSDQEQTQIVMEKGSVNFKALNAPLTKRVTAGEFATVDTKGTLTHQAGGLSFEENNGALTIEAEHFYRRDNKVAGYQWEKRPPAIALAETINSEPTNSSTPEWDGGKGPTLSYRTYFHTPGNYKIWVRARTTTPQDNAIFACVNHDWLNNSTVLGVASEATQWQWSEAIFSGHLLDAWKWERLKTISQERLHGDKRSTETTVLKIPKPGFHTLSLSLRTNSVELDKIVLKREGSTPPTKLGPAESPHRF